MFLIKLVSKHLARRLVISLATAVAVKVLSRRRVPVLAVLVLAAPDLARACSVCAGDPESPMMKGAAAGVYVMIGFIGFVLVSIAGTACFWMARSRKLSQGADPQILS